MKTTRPNRNHNPGLYQLLPPEQQFSADFQIVIAYWKTKFGCDEVGRPKGIISRLIETEQATVNPAALEQTDAATA